jgi:hypothetical protein
VVDCGFEEDSEGVGAAEDLGCCQCVLRSWSRSGVGLRRGFGGSRIRETE